MADRAVVVVAHGSRAEEANDAHRAVAAELDTSVEAAVTAGFLELAEPSIGDAIDGAIAAGATAVAVLPHLLYPGRHLTRDIPGIVDAAAARHPGVAVRLLPAFGADPGVVSLLAAQARAAFPSEPTPDR
jgi:sirohydrochlorin cobaltochelatase